MLNYEILGNRKNICFSINEQLHRDVFRKLFYYKRCITRQLPGSPCRDLLRLLANWFLLFESDLAMLIIPTGFIWYSKTQLKVCTGSSGWGQLINPFLLYYFNQIFRKPCHPYSQSQKLISKYIFLVERDRVIFIPNIYQLPKA